MMNTELLQFILLLLGAFLLGYLVARVLYSKTGEVQYKYIDQEQSITSTQPTNKLRTKKTKTKDDRKISAKAVSSDPKDSPRVQSAVLPSRKTALSDFETPGQIKAIQTRGREGKLDGSIHKGNKSKLSLDFERIGEATSGNRDDLQKMIGVGPFIEEKLNVIGIYNFDQISRLNSNDIEIVTEMIEFFPGRIERDEWVQQAESFRNQEN